MRILPKNHPDYPYAEYYDGDCFDNADSDCANDDVDCPDLPEGHWDVKYWDDDDDCDDDDKDII